MINVRENQSMEVFWDADHESTIRFQKFQMVDPIWRPKDLQNYSNFIKIGIYGFFGSLIMDLLLVFPNSRWRIQYGGQNFSKLLKFHENQTKAERATRACRHYLSYQLYQSMKFFIEALKLALSFNLIINRYLPFIIGLGYKGILGG